MNRRRPPLEPLDYAILVVLGVVAVLCAFIGFIAGMLT